MFSVEQRDALRERVLQLGRGDRRVVAGAAVGSLAVGAGDRFSDLDLTFAVRDADAAAAVLEDWTQTLAGELAALHLVDLARPPTVYRVFLLPGGLQLDLSVTPASDFRPAGPRFQLLFGETAAGTAGATGPGTLFIPTPAIAGDIFGWGVIYALHARSCIERGRLLQAEHYVGAVRDHALALACLRLGLTAVQARGYDDLPDATKAAFRHTHVGSLEPSALTTGLSAATAALTAEAEAAGIATALTVRERLADL